MAGWLHWETSAASWCFIVVVIVEYPFEMFFRDNLRKKNANATQITYTGLENIDRLLDDAYNLRQPFVSFTVE